VAKLRWGFVKESEEYAVEFRQELGLMEHDPICPFILAAHLEIPVGSISAHPTISNDVKRHFAGKGKSQFSAVTLTDGLYREILYNDYQHSNRHSSSIMHEIAHIVLGHPPKPPFLGDACRDFNPIMEKEANELGFTILVPKPAALFAVETFNDREAAAIHFGVSKVLLSYRIRKADAVRWSQNRRRRSAA
jgi:Zn-dependent peptidase ImmA (M78 family)